MIGAAAKTSPLIASYKDLDVYKSAYAAALEIHKATLVFPKEELFALVSQMRRASKSICANLAEGFAKQSESDAEFRRFLTIGIGSANEMQVWINFACDLGYIEANNASQLSEKYLSVAKMLNSLRKKSYGV